MSNLIPPSAPRSLAGLLRAAGRARSAPSVPQRAANPRHASSDLVEHLEQRTMLSGTFGNAFRLGSADLASDPVNETGQRIVVDSAGFTTVAVRFKGTVDFDPGPFTVNLSSPGPDIAQNAVARYAPDGSLVWVRAFGDSGSHHDINGLAIDSDGNVLIAGRFRGVNVDFDPDGVNTAPLTSGDGGLADSAFVLKLDSSGNFVWVRGFGGTSDVQAFGLAVDPSDNVIITGLFNGTADFDPGAGAFNLTATGSLGGAFPAQGSAFVANLTAAGDLAWAVGLTGTGFSVGTAVTSDGDGNVFVAGAFSGAVDFDPGAGTHTLTATGAADSTDAFVVRLDTAGLFTWADRLGGSSGLLSADGLDGVTEGATSIRVDNSGRLLVAGVFTGTADFDPGAPVVNLVSAGGTDAFAASLHADTGALVWARRLGGAGNDRAAALDLDAADNVYLTGSFTGTADFDPGAPVSNLVSAGGKDAFVVRLSSTGTLRWARRLGGSGDDIARSIAVAPDTSVFTTGEFRSAADFDPGPATRTLVAAMPVAGLAGSDIFVSELLQSGPGYTAVSIAATDAAAAESTPASNTGTLRISRTGSTFQPLTVAFTRTGTATFGATGAGDYTLAAGATNLPTGSVVIPAGAAFVDITLTPVDDNRVEATETATLTIASSANYSPAPVPAQRSASVSIADNEPTLSISTPDNSAAETTVHEVADTGMVRITRTGPTVGNLRVSFAITGTAARGSSATTGDYLLSGNQLTPTGTTVVIPDGSDHVDILLSPRDDQQVEHTETATITLLASTAYRIPALAADRAATVSIHDNEPDLTIATIDPFAAETTAGQPADTATFRISRSGSTDRDLDVTITMGGLATRGAPGGATGDYSLSGGGITPTGTHITIPAGEDHVDIVVDIRDDAIADGAETVSMTLVPSTSYTVPVAPANRTSTIFISDNEPIVTIHATDPSAAEAPAGAPDHGTFQFARVTGSLAAPLTVRFTRSGTATLTTDYTLVATAHIPDPIDPLAPGTIVPVNLPAGATQVTFPANADTLDITVVPVDDRILDPVTSPPGHPGEFFETVILTLVKTADYGFTLGPTDRAATVEIADNEPVLSITAQDPTATETVGGQAPDTATFRISRAGPTDYDLPVNVVRSGSATFGAAGDYTLSANGANLTGTTVTIPTGQTFVDVTVTPVNDHTAEPTETVRLTLAASGAAVQYRLPALAADRSATASILDDEPTLSITSGGTPLAENSSDPGIFTISRTGDTTDPLTVRFTIGGTATAGSDYAALGGTTIVIPAGASSTTLEVRPLLDTRTEAAETVTVTLASSTAYFLPTPASARTASITITNTPPPAPAGADAAILSLTYAPRTFSLSRPDAAFSITSTIRNQGAAASGPFSVRFFLSTDRAFDGGTDIQIGATQGMASLAAGASKTSVSALSPDTLSSPPAIGFYYLIMVVDVPGGDINASNNVFVSLLNNIRVVA